jgi:hypothetical protein
MDDTSELSDDEFYARFGYCWDYVFVFKVFNDLESPSEFQQSHSMKRTLHNIEAGGLETYMYYSVQRDEVYCKVRAPLPRLKQEADRSNFNLLLDPVALKAAAMMGVYDRGVMLVKPIKIVDEKHASPLAPFEFIYGEYINDDDDNGKRVAPLYTKYPPNQTPFSGVHRRKLILQILEAQHVTPFNGCGLDIGRLITEQAVMAFYPLHNELLVKKLKGSWLKMCAFPWQQPYDEIKDYFGEKVGLYFRWLGNYTAWLVFPAVFGIAAFADSRYGVSMLV